MVIKTNRDDSPKESYWSAGTLVLAVCKKDQYEMRQKKKIARTLISQQKTDVSRKEFARSQSMSGDMDAVMRNYDMANRSEMARTRSEFSENNASGVMTNLDMLQKLNEAENMLNSDPDAAMATLGGLKTPQVDLTGF